MRLDARRLPRRPILGKRDGARKRGRGGKDKEWVDCVEKGVRAFGISGDGEALSLYEEPYKRLTVRALRRLPGRGDYCGRERLCGWMADGYPDGSYLGETLRDKEEETGRKREGAD